MKTNKGKKIFTILIIGIIAVVLMLLSRISFAVDGGDTATTADGEEIPVEKVAEAVVTHPDGSLEITQFTPRDLADADGREFYCVNYGVRFHKAGEDLRIETALKYGDMDGNKKQWPRTHDYCRDFEHEGEITYPYMHCVGRHYDLIDPNGEYHPDLAYILTYPTLGEWDDLKQNAVWATDFAKARGKHTGISAEGQALYQEALRYEEFFDKTANAEGASTTDPNIDAKDETDLDEVRTLVDYEAQTLTVGPLSIDYINGAYDGVAFGGISDMYFIGYNSEDEVVNEKIEIEKYIYDGTEYDLEFFEPTMDDNSYVDYSEQVYPKGVTAGEEEFYLKIANPNEGVTDPDESVSKLVLHIDFQWMSASAYVCEMDAKVYKVCWDDDHDDHCHGHSDGEGGTYHCGGCCYYCTAYSWLEAIDAQDHINVLRGERQLYKTYLEIPMGDDKIDITMKLGGYVWEDVPTGKETMADGVSNTTGENVDIRLKNVKVSLYDEDGNLVKLSTKGADENAGEDDIYHRINPTYTDDNGEYLFLGLDPLKKYYVVFEYNGQRYLPTEYLNTGGGQYGSAEQMVNAGLYNTTEWEVTSKGTESDGGEIEGVKISRNDFDERFKEIASYPENYPSSNTLGVGSRNAVYTQLDLMGYTLEDDGTYSKTETQLVDGYEFDDNGIETDNFVEGEISSRVREFIESREAFPTEDDMIDIYHDIAGGDEETLRKLQFIEDCYIQAYSGSPFSGEIDLYPVYDQFIINDDVGIAGASDYDTSSITVGNTTYEPIYPGQLYINLGLWRRQEFDAAIRKDVYKAALKINNKTVVYNYDKRVAEEEGSNNADGNDNNTYWDINVRMADYEAYYNSGYNREIYETDYNYDSAALNHPGSDLEVYITYKITVRNQSMSIMSQIQEVVDYYDADYTYKPNLSWIIYRDGNNNRTTVNKDQYYEMMDQDQSVIDNESTSAVGIIDNSKEVKAEEGKSRYGNEKDLGNGYQNLYIRGLEDKKLATGESAYIYLTFEVNKEGNRIILDDDSSPKENIAEINGYVTYYRDGTELPNGVSKGSGDIAGLLDRDSNPGNLVKEDLRGEKYEKNFEDDTDRAPSLRVIIDAEAVRKANGTVWEDERTETVGDSSNSTDAIIGDGIRQEGEEIGISGVTVQLVEKCIDGSEYIWQETTTNSEGKYNFESYIPGDYVIRFYYGDTESTAIPSGEQPVSYNGQDFKSTIYQDGIEQSGTTDIDGRFTAYTNTATQNESGTYGYDIYKADSDSTNYSDAKDIWSTGNRSGLNIIGPVNSAREVAGRDRVIDYSDENVTNHIAEVLASPYSGDSSLYNEFMDNTYMTAETGVIVVEFEYDRQQTDGNKGTANNSSNSSKDYVGENQYNSNYTLNNIDLGLTERPKAQLEIDKSITNIKVTLANNSILFDINEAANNALWQDHKEYSIDKNKIDAEDDRVGGNDYYQEGDAIGMYEEYYNEDSKHRYSYREEIDNIVRDTDKGLVQITMDEELMHGATIQVTYAVKITNVGEIDYVDGDNKNFYYKGDTSGAKVVTTTAEQVLDYVQNNFQFEANNSTNSGDGWSAISSTDILSGDLVNNRLSNNIGQFNTIIQTSSFGATDLRPGDETTKTLILSQLITPENTEDDLQYTNMVEIVKTSNTNGRRMAYSVVGNQDPLLDDASEVDSSTAERIVILTPFGENNFFYIIAGIVALILVAGIVIIKVKVLNKRN